MDADSKKSVSEIKEEVGNKTSQATKPPPGVNIKKWNNGVGEPVKQPWTKEDIETKFPPVTFVPEEDMRVCWNGHSMRFFADREVTCPSVFKNLYDNKRASGRKHPHTIQTPAGPVRVDSGAGSLEPEKYEET